MIRKSKYVPIFSIISLFLAGTILTAGNFSYNKSKESSSLFIKGNEENSLPQIPQVADSPFGSIQLSSPAVNRTETLYFNVTVAAWGEPIENIDWNITIWNKTSGGDWDYKCLGLANGILSGSWTPSLSTTEGTYYVVLWMYNGTHAIVTQEFEVLNNKPRIREIIFDQFEIYRGTTFNISVNVTDKEIADFDPDGDGDNADIYVRAYYRDTQGRVSYFGAIEYASNFYVAECTIDLDFSLGVYLFWVQILDYRPEMEERVPFNSSTYDITILNNHPTIDLDDDVLLNGEEATDGITVKEGQTLNISVIADDEEDTVHFLTFAFFNDDTYDWQNYTLNYHHKPRYLVVYVDDLGVGTWYLYISATDVDGGVGSTVSPIAVEILADEWSPAAPVVSFFIGVVITMLIMGIIIAARSRSPKTTPPRDVPQKALDTKKKEAKQASSSKQGGQSEQQDTPRRKIRRRIN